MKKSIILVLICITLVFVSFVAGFYIGKNYNHGDVRISGLLPESTAVPTTVPKATTPPGVAASPSTKPVLSGLIDINHASLEELDLLPGIGPATAQAIIDYRTEFGDFQTPEDLLNVAGIGEKKLEAIREYITTGG